MLVIADALSNESEIAFQMDWWRTPPQATIDENNEASKPRGPTNLL
jgi:hypothetical protein